LLSFRYYAHDYQTPAVKPPLSMPGRAVSLQGGTVVKIQEPGASRRERLRTLAGREVGLQTGLFVVPEIISSDDSRGEIVFEHLALTGLREVLSDRQRGLELVRRAAVTLAAIHRQMRSGEMAIEVKSGIMAISPGRNPVPLHGDFGVHNVCYLSASDEIAIIDWANAEWTGVDADLGPPEIDIAVFLVSLFHRRPFGPWPISHRHELARSFLDRYTAASPHGLNLGTLRTIVAAIGPGHGRLTRRNKGSLRALGYYHNPIDLYFFLKRLPGNAFAAR
jgi:hypothetical protein